MRHNILQLLMLGALPATCFGGTISIQPHNIDVAVGNPTSINVDVSGLTDLYAFQFDIAFDPAVLSAVSVREGSLFSSLGVLFFPGTINNAAGTITFISDSLSGPGPGISADGTLAQILFSSIGTGSSSVGLGNIILLDSGQNDIAAAALGATVTVVGGSSVPEPATLGLMALAIAISLHKCRRTRP